MDSSVSLDEYKLNCELIGHSADVRSVCAAAGDNILSGSRDKTARIWKNMNGAYQEGLILKDHKNFVACVYYLEELNVVCTASNDSTICLYKSDLLVPFAILREHTNTICSLSKGLEPNLLVSGSWDKTARLWYIEETQCVCLSKMEGHEAAVWAVTALKPNKYATGSADKNIFIWNGKGEKLMVLKGHQDCVRGLIGLDDGSLISCSNDAVIKYWSSDGECLKELFGHTNYIYSITLNKALSEDVIVSCGEDGTVRMWSLKSGGELGNSLSLPAQSVWSVDCLRNGDIVAGSSDGVVRIFSRDPNRHADENTLAAYEAAVNVRKQEVNNHLGGVKLNDLPGPESLLQPGQNGQTRIVRQPDGKILCYEWSNNQWNCLGDVMGAAEDKENPKKIYEGKEYDYVFSVDISDTEPPLKLPYNRDEDPWHAAQKFIHKNNLPQVYLDQVANFIIKNADSIAPQTVSREYADPFTGASRYTPSNGNSNRLNSLANMSGNVDPFTSTSSYHIDQKPGLEQNKNKSEPLQIGHFPVKIYATIDTCDPSKIYDKLREFNNKAAQGQTQLSDDFLQAAVNLLDKESSMDKLSVEALQFLLNWPKDILFPVLDIARVAVRNQQTCSMLMTNALLKIIINRIDCLPPNQLMAIRCIVNMMSHPFGRKLIEISLPEILLLISRIRQGSVNLQIAIATFYLNLSIYKLEHSSFNFMTTLLEFFKWASSEEALYRAMQALGNLACSSEKSTISEKISSDSIVTEKMCDLAEKHKNTTFIKVAECANLLIATI